MESSNYKIIFYTDKQGKCPTDEFLDGLELKVRAKVEKWMQKLEQHGPNLPRPYADTVKGKIRELRVIFHSDHHRLLFFFCGKTIVITHGFIKKTRKIPKTEIERAERLMEDFLQGHKKGGEIGS